MISAVHNRSKTFFLAGILITLGYYIPYFINGENSYIQILDNLDSTIAYLNVLKENGTLFNTEAPFPAMEGLKVSNIAYCFLPRLLLVDSFDPFTSYILNELIGRLIGFIGMWLFLTRYLLKESKPRTIVSFLTSLCFSLMAYYADYGLSVMGQPLLAYAFLNLKEEKLKISSYLIIIFVALYSSLVLAGVFIGITLFAYYLYLKIKSKKTYKSYVTGFCILVLSYIISNYSLFANFLSPVISHRTEIIYSSSIRETITRSLEMLKVTQIHTGSLPVIFILFYIFLIYIHDKQIDRKVRFLLKVIATILLWHLIFNLIKYMFPKAHILTMFQSDRFYFLLPFLWLCVTALLFDKIVNYKYGRYLLLTAFTLLVGVTFRINPEYKNNLKQLCGISISEPTYRQFYDTRLFDNIHGVIGDDSNNNKVACLGFFPSVAQYNGFYTLNGYFQNYPLAYKHAFRKVIAGELKKSAERKAYYDHWGSRCYLYSSELHGDLWGKDKQGEIRNLEIDMTTLKELGCTYLFSAVNICNYQELGLQYIGTYTTPTSFWEIKVYKVEGNLRKETAEAPLQAFLSPVISHRTEDAAIRGKKPKQLNNLKNTQK